MTAEQPLVLLDAVEFGLRASERAHRVLGQTTWLENQEPRSYVGGEDYVVRQRPLAHLRDIFKTTDITLAIPASHRGMELVLDVGLRGQKLGEPEVQHPARLLAVTDGAMWELARFVFPEKWVWRHFRVRVPPELTAGETLVLSLEENANSISPEEGYGKSIGYFHLYGFPTQEVVGDSRNLPTAHHGGTSQRASVPFSPDIVLVMTPVWDVGMPPISIAVLDAFLRGNGVRTLPLDLNIETFLEVPPERRWLWHANNCMHWHSTEFTEHKVWPWLDEYLGRMAERLVRTDSPVLAFFIATTTLPITRRICQRVKELAPERTIVWGGPGLLHYHPSVLGDAWDYLVFGAGEHPLLALVRGERPPIPGVLPLGTPVGRRFDAIAVRAKLLDMESLPLLDYEGFALSRYLEPWQLPMLTSRGCIHHCRYCCDTKYYAPYRHLSGRRAFEQIELLVRRTGRTHFEFADLLCNGDLPALEEMSRRLADADLGATWGSFAVIRADMGRDLLRLVARGGCRKMHYGFETGSDRMLGLMNRGYTAAEAERVLRDTSEAGIEVVINLIVGFPGENDQSIAETVAFLARNARYIDRVETVNPVYIMAASDLDRDPERFGIRLNEGGDWAAEGTDFATRTRWIYQIMEQVTRSGVPCYRSVHQDFSIIPDQV